MRRHERSLIKFGLVPPESQIKIPSSSVWKPKDSDADFEAVCAQLGLGAEEWKKGEEGQSSILLNELVYSK
jgi:hypothetical protein